jgi:hypothetical protein
MGRVSRDRTNIVGGLIARPTSGLGVANSQVAVKARVGYVLMLLSRRDRDFLTTILGPECVLTQ